MKFSKKISGGGGRIRTHGPREGSTVFKTAAIDHSATPPRKFLNGRGGYSAESWVIQQGLISKLSANLRI